MNSAETQGAPGRIVWSCVLDDTPALWQHIRVWLATLTGCAGVRADDIIIHHVTPLRPDVASLLQRLGVVHRRVERFDPRTPHSNKIQQCFTDFGAARKIILTDVDLAFLARPPIEREHQPVAGRLVDFPNPPVDMLDAIFERAEIRMMQAVSRTDQISRGTASAFATAPANFNGGLYILDANIVCELGHAWARWVRWLLDRPHLLGRYAVHVDQVGFCMAVNELKLACETLPRRWNLASHVETPPSELAPLIIHHHGRLDDRLCLLPLKPERNAEDLARANIVITQFLNQYESPFRSQTVPQKRLIPSGDWPM